MVPETILVVKGAVRPSQRQKLGLSAPRPWINGLRSVSKNFVEDKRGRCEATNEYSMHSEAPKQPGMTVGQVGCFGGHEAL